MKTQQSLSGRFGGSDNGITPFEDVQPRALGYDVNPRGTELFGVMLAFLIIAWVFVGLRVYVRLFMIKKLALDDWLMIAAVLVYTAYGIIAIWGIIAGGTGEHKSFLTAETASIALEAWYLCEVIYSPLSALVRTSIGIFLLRIAHAKLHKYIIYATLAVVWAMSVVYFVLILLQCTPPSYFWEQVLGASGHCIDQDVIPGATIGHSVISATCDFVLALLPVAMLWNVQLNARTKITVAVLLGLGFFAGVVLLVRIPYVKFLAVSADFLFETIDVAIWSVMEPSLGIIAGCAATLRPLMKVWGLGLGNSSRRYAQYGGHRNNKSSTGNNVLTIGTAKNGGAPWRISRGVHKLEDVDNNHDSDNSGPTLHNHGNGGSGGGTGRASDGNKSDIELVPQSASSRTHTNGSSDWDVDIENEAPTRAVVVASPVPPAAAPPPAGPSSGLNIWGTQPMSPGRAEVHVQTSIEIVASQTAPPSTAGLRLPLQGERTITINGPDGEGGLFMRHRHEIENS